MVELPTIDTDSVSRYCRSLYYTYAGREWRLKDWRLVITVLSNYLLPPHPPHHLHHPRQLPLAQIRAGGQTEPLRKEFFGHRTTHRLTLGKDRAQWAPEMHRFPGTHWARFDVGCLQRQPDLLAVYTRLPYIPVFYSQTRHLYKITMIARHENTTN